MSILCSKVRARRYFPVSADKDVLQIVVLIALSDKTSFCRCFNFKKELQKCLTLYRSPKSPMEQLYAILYTLKKAPYFHLVSLIDRQRVRCSCSLL